MISKPTVLLAVVAGLVLAAGCSRSRTGDVATAQVAPGAAADTIFTGGDIVTVNDAQPTVEALAVKDGRILAVGARSVVEAAHKGESTTVVDLAGKALLPGFLDPHSHYFSSLTVANQVNVFAPPAGPGKDIPGIVAALKKFRDEHKVPSGRVDPGLRLRRQRDAERHRADPRRPRRGLPGQPGARRARVDARRRAELGRHEAVRHFRRDEDAAGRRHRAQARAPNEPAGLVMEMAYLPIFASLPTPERRSRRSNGAAPARCCTPPAASRRRTRARRTRPNSQLMQRAAAAGADIIDVVAYPFVTDFDAVLAKNPGRHLGQVRQPPEARRRARSRSTVRRRAGPPTSRRPYLTGGPGRREELERRARVPRGGREGVRQEGL